MSSFRRFIGLGAALGLIAALVPVVSDAIRVSDVLGKLKLGGARSPAPDLAGLELLRIELRPNHATAPLPGRRTAELTLDVDAQRAALAQMKRYRLPEAGTVVLDVKTGKVLVYASYVAQGEPFDVNVRAEAPAASVFKIVTGAALVEKAGLDARTEQCYHGGRSQIAESELTDDPERDKWCATLGIAMGRSINVVMGRLARKHLTPEDLTAVGGALGFGAPVPFAVKNEAPTIEIPDDPTEFARSAAGFWHTSLSPLAGALLAQTVANKGVALEPRIVSAVYEGKEEVWKDDAAPRALRRALKRETATEVTRMMIQTVASGSAFKSFHDSNGRPFLPGMQIAGKTGTLSREEKNRHYTWFVGFAPAHDPEVAIASLIVNEPEWHIKATHLARDVLRAYFAGRGHKGVTRP